jgi:hypothetical protein
MCPEPERHRATEPRELGRDMDGNMARSRNLIDPCFHAAVRRSLYRRGRRRGFAFALGS